MARVATAIDRLQSLPDDQRTLGVFRLVHPLGKGGFAPVWLAREVYGTTELRTVAIKLFAPEDGSPSTGSGDSGTTRASQERERIFEEARALCQVEHPNVVRFYSIYHDPLLRLIGLVMEYVRGTPLDRRVRELGERGEAMPIDEVLHVGVAIASALEAVHQAGLIHRDIKPANVVEAAGVFKLIDFGIAAAERRRPRDVRHAKAAPAKMLLDDLLIEVGTKASTVSETRNAGGPTDDAFSLTGTLGYIDPTCVDSLSAATPGSDLYALGATLFECVTGRVPAAMAARSAGMTGLSAEVLDGRARAPSLASAAPDVPAALAKLVDALLDPSPAKRPRSAEAVAWELERIRREIAGRARPLPPEDVGPFRGLGRFEEKDRDVYFGRAVEIAASLEMARSRGLVALIGASGSGKSSLARAGVLPAIAEGGLGTWPKAWDTVVTTPGVDARASIALALAPFVEDAATRSAESLVAGLGERAQSTGRGVCLLVDQLEELITVSSAASAGYAVKLLAQLGAQPIPGVRCIVAARRDLLDPLLALRELGRALPKATLLVSPMTDATWGEVLDQALAAYGYELEDDALRDELRAELAGTARAMPLVQFALTALWARRDKAKRIIPRAALKAIGGIAGALEMHADATLARHAADDATNLEIARRVLIAMTTPQGTRRTVERAQIEALAPRAAAMLERLERARLVVDEAEGVTLAHEALLTQWGRLRGWIAEGREDRLLAEAIERDAKEWAGEREAERLWKKRRLVAAEDLAKKGHAELTDTARAFVAAGRATERRRRTTIALLAAIATLAAAGGGVAYVINTKAAEVAAQAATKRAEAETDEANAANAKLADDQKALTAANDKISAQKKDAQAQAAHFQQLFDDLQSQIAQANVDQLKKLQAQAQAAKAAAGDTTTEAPAVAATTAPAPQAPAPTTAPAVERVGEPP